MKICTECGSEVKDPMTKEEIKSVIRFDAFGYEFRRTLPGDWGYPNKYLACSKDYSGSVITSDSIEVLIDRIGKDRGWK